MLLAAFEGWNDAGNAASEAAAYLMRAWSGTTFAVFDSEQLFDYTSSRPRCAWNRARPVASNGPRSPVERCRPRHRTGHRLPVGARTAAALAQLRRGGPYVWPLGVTLAVLLGALLADVPHTRPVRVTGGAGNPELAALAGVEPSYYEGPTGIVGVVADALGRAGIPTTSLWASVPHYVSQSSSPKATLALVERTARVLGTEVDVAELRISAGGLRAPDKRAGGLRRGCVGLCDPSRGTRRRGSPRRRAGAGTRKAPAWPQPRANASPPRSSATSGNTVKTDLYPRAGPGPPGQL